MHAIVISEPGGPEVLEWGEVPDPVAEAGEVIVEVAAAGLNRADLMQRQGFYPPPEGTAPYPGLEVSGQICEVGPGVTGWAVGDEVCALLAGGGYAERVTVPTGQLLPVPKATGLLAAAALPEAACTVWSTIVMHGGLKAGETLLVHGGASGIGAMAIQVGKALGARVVCTVGGPERAEYCRSLGADQVIDYRTEDFVEYGPYDVILDIIGGEYLKRNVQALATGGRLTVIGLQGGGEGELDLWSLVVKRAAVIGTSLRYRPLEEKAEIVAAVREHLWPLVEAGSVRPIIDQKVPLPQAAKAHELLETGGHTGKILLTR
jgi:putative PIG3 family NAD(P)H quinone oxidoreductase